MNKIICRVLPSVLTILISFGVTLSGLDTCLGQGDSGQSYSLPANGAFKPGRTSSSRKAKTPLDTTEIERKIQEALQRRENRNGQNESTNRQDRSTEDLPEYIGPPVDGNQQQKNRTQPDVLDNLPSSIRDGLGIIGPINLQILPGSIVVTGPNQDDVRKVERLIQQLMESATRSRPKRRIVKLHKAHAEYVAKWAQHLYDRNYQARQGNVTITAKSQSEVFLVGEPSAIDEAEKIVSALDK